MGLNGVYQYVCNRDQFLFTILELDIDVSEGNRSG